MACIQTLSGLARDCTKSMGGVKEVYIANHDDVDFASMTIASDIITNIAMIGAATFKKYEFRPQTAELTLTPQVNKENGSTYWQSILSMVFHKMDTAKRLEINALSLGDLAVIVVDNNGKKWFLGKEHPVTLSGGEGGTGKNFGDANRYGVQLEDNSIETPYEVTATIPV